MKAIVAGIGVIVAGMWSQAAPADIYQNSYGLGIDPFVTFDEYGAGYVDGTEWQAEYGLTFFGADLEVDDYDSFPGIDGLNLLAYADPMFAIEFDAPVGAFATAWVTNPGYTTFTAYMGNTMVDQATLATDYQYDDIAFVVFDNMYFDRIEATIDASFTSMRIDNLQMIPAPAAFAPLLLGLAAGRRRRA